MINGARNGHVDREAAACHTVHCKQRRHCPGVLLVQARGRCAVKRWRRMRDRHACRRRPSRQLSSRRTRLQALHSPAVAESVIGLSAGQASGSAVAHLQGGSRQGQGSVSTRLCRFRAAQHSAAQHGTSQPGVTHNDHGVVERLVPTRGAWINAAGISAAAAAGAVGLLLGACHATRSLQVMPLGAQHAHAARAACTPRHSLHEVLIDGKANHDRAHCSQPDHHVGSCGIKPNIARRGLRSRGRAKQSVHHRHLQGAGVNAPTAAAPTVPAKQGWNYPLNTPHPPPPRPSLRQPARPSLRQLELGTKGRHSCGKQWDVPLP